MYSLVIVDDEAEIRNGIANYFPWNQLGFEVIGTCSNGITAKEILLKQKVDVLLTDIVMPDMDGLELAAFVKEHKIPTTIFILSGYPEFGYAQRALELGVRKYILKPTKYNTLYEVFSELKAELDYYSLENQQADYYSSVIISVKEYVKKNPIEASLESAASFVHLSPAYLSQIFKLKAGITLSDYVLQKKLKQAKEMLADPANRILDISLLLGYSNPNNFSRAFKTMFGLTPTEYRATLPDVD